MSKTIKTAMNWTKLLVALVFVCSMFSSSAMAQTKPEKPLDEEAVSALIDELKQGLPDLIDDEATVTAITEKWDAREDLAGKIKYQILKLLFEDVKSVVTDEELALKIWHKWHGIEEEPKPEPKPVETRKPNIWIKIVHEGAYIAHFDLTWDEPGKPNNTWTQHGKLRGWQYVIELSGDATNIRLRMQNDTGLVWQPQREIFNRVLQPSDLNKCYRITGTTLGSSYDNNCQ